MNLLFLSSCLILIVLTRASSRCKEGANYWCLNDETAKECSVINVCKFMRRIKPSYHSISSKIKFESKFKQNAPPVTITLYYESLCPDCIAVLQHQLFPTYHKLNSSGILKINFVPFGNAREYESGGRYVFYCQHGQAECEGNLIETCALHHYPEPAQHVPFIQCLEYYGPTLTNTKYCAFLQKMSYSVIYTCITGTGSNLLEHQMAVKTAALNPPHQFVPWFTLNGYHSAAIQQQLSTNMLAYVCSVYTGTKPAACSRRQRVGTCYKEQ